MLLKCSFALKALIQLGSPRTNSLLVMRAGELVHEFYRKGYNKHRPDDIHSITKSVTSALVGIAIAEGHIGGVEDKAVQYFPEAPEQPGWQESKADITIEHLLTMRSGIRYGGRENWDAFENSEDSALMALLLPQAHVPGEKFAYEDPPISILAGIIERTTGQKLLDYANEKLFAPLGIANPHWVTAADGLPYGGFGLHLSPGDLLRFGQLYLQEGSYDGRQVVPAEWIRRSRPQGKKILSYGYLFWNDYFRPRRSYYSANGVYGQFVAIRPGCKTVIVRTGSPGKVGPFILKKCVDYGIM